MSNLPIKQENAVLVVTPQEQINQAAAMAMLLKDVVSKAGLSRKLGGRKEHLEYEAWATIARWFNCTPITEWTKPIKDGDKIIGWEARVNVVNEQGRVIGTSEGMCMSDEQNWRGKPSYALRSMAQTRTAGKALRSLFAHIAVLAGYAATPAEEMDGVETQEPPAPKKEPSKPQPTVAQLKKAVLAKAVAALGGTQQALNFISWVLKAEQAEEWTAELLHTFIAEFEDRLALYKEEQSADVPL